MIDSMLNKPIKIKKLRKLSLNEILEILKQFGEDPKDFYKRFGFKRYYEQENIKKYLGYK